MSPLGLIQKTWLQRQEVHQAGYFRNDEEEREMRYGCLRWANWTYHPPGSAMAAAWASLTFGSSNPFSDIAV